MSTRIILVRHAETPGSLERRFTGSTDVHLTEAGQLQAQRLGRRLREVEIDEVHVSPLTRCRQTASAVTSLTGHEAAVVEELRECHFGILENHTLEEALSAHGDEMIAWFGTEDSAPPEGESWAQVGQRLMRWLSGVTSGRDGRTVLAVTHGGPVLWLTRHITGAPHSAMAVFDIDPASVTLFQQRHDTWRLRLFNDTSHLADPLLFGSARSNLPA